MSQSVEQFINSDNFQLIVNRKRGEWLEADRSGRLYLIIGLISKIWFVIRNFFCCGSIIQRTSYTINNTCKKFLTICSDSFFPLDSDNVQLIKYNDFIRKLIDLVTKIRSSLYKESSLRNLKDLLKHPEIVEAKKAMKLGIYPEKISEGVSGSYILRDRNKQPIAVFKPAEQEPGQQNNLVDLGMRQIIIEAFGIEPGTSYQREKVAYLLDHEHFANVPKTIKANFSRKFFEIYSTSKDKLRGSFQKYVSNSKHAWDYYQILPKYLSSAKGDQIPDHEIHKIAILDIRILNCDRHLKNFLVDDEFHIHPIDHGYSLPGKAGYIRFQWMHFPQSYTPFSKEELKYIEQLDPEKDIALLRKYVPSINEKGLFRIKIATQLLKQCANAGLTCYQIAELMTGNRGGLLKTIVDYFRPTASMKISFFETEICQPLLRNHHSIDSHSIHEFLNRKIQNYLKGY